MTTSFRSSPVSDLALVVAPKGKSSYWHLMPIGLLGSLVALQLVLVSLAVGDPSVAIEKDYYQKATDWDEAVQRRAMSDRLRWSAGVELKPTHHATTVVVRMQDSSATSLAGLDVQVDAFHNARAGDVQHVVLREVSEGVYQGDAPLTRPGLWEVRIVARHGEDVFLDTVRLDRPWTTMEPSLR